MSALLLAGCGARAVAPGARIGGEPRPAGPGAPGPGPSTGASVFDQAWTWDDERGGRVSFAAWRGRPLVVALVYTSCTTVCPLTVEKMRQVSAALERQGRPAEYVLVTLDPFTDTSERLREFKNARGLPGAWHLLRGPEDQTRALAVLLRLKTLNMGDHVVHEAKLVFLDAAGKVIGHSRG
jgi:protein SCO1/2